MRICFIARLYSLAGTEADYRFGVEILLIVLPYSQTQCYMHGFCVAREWQSGTELSNELNWSCDIKERKNRQP